MGTKEYSKEEILELIEQTKEQYNISNMSDLGTILGEYNHNWYYYYKNRAKKAPDFLEVLLAVQEPQEMFEKLRAAADRLLQKKNLEKNDMKKLVRYAKSMTYCMTQSAEQFILFMQNEKNRLEAIQDPYDRRACAIAIIDQGRQRTEHVIKMMSYAASLLLYFVEQSSKKVQGGMLSAKNQRKVNFDLKACYEAHCNTPEFGQSRKKHLSEEEERAACWYKIRCNHIKMCKYYEFSQKVEQFIACKEEISRQFENLLNGTIEPEKYMKRFKKLCGLLEELELPEE